MIPPRQPQWQPKASRPRLIIKYLARRPLIWIVLVAFAARMIGLTYHSLWFDEVMSTYWAARPVSDIWRVGLSLTQDKHPPLYYFMLHLWTLPFVRSSASPLSNGWGDTIVRSLGVVIGTLAVLPTFGIGTRLGDRRSGVFGALLVALNPFLIWYSQEARMFMPATTFALAGLYGVLRLWDRRVQPGPTGLATATGFARVLPGIILMILGFSAALYTYLFSAFLLPVVGGWLLVLWWNDRDEHCARGRFTAGALTLLAITILFLPLARSAWRVSGGEAVPGQAFAGMWQAIWRFLKVYSFGWPLWPGQVSTWAAIGAGLLALLGLLTLPGRRTVEGRHGIGAPGGPLLASWLAIPVLTGSLLLARDTTVFAEDRYFVFLVPALCLAWGAALEWLWTWRLAAGVAGLALVLGLTLTALPRNWAPENRREAWREAAAMVAGTAGPNDAVLVQPDYVHLAFDRYFGGRQPVFYPFTHLLADPAEVERPLGGLAGYDVIWLVQSHLEGLDPGNLVAGWFAGRFPLITEAFPAGIALRAFAQHYRTSEVPQGVSLLENPAGFDKLELLGCSRQPAALAARDDVYHPPSGWVHATTYWTADGGPPATDLIPTARLVDAGGQVWGDRLEREGDTFHIWPTSRWVPGEVVRADFDVNLNPRTPKGTYQLVIGVPGFATQVACGAVEVK